MTKFYLATAFSLNMLEAGGYTVSVNTIHRDGVRNILSQGEVKSFVGHQSTADLLTTILGTEIRMNRESLSLPLAGRWSLIVAQYTGPRLMEGATELPEGAKMVFWQVYPIN